MNKLSSRYMIKLSDAVSMLPNIRPRLAVKRLREWHDQYFDQFWVHSKDVQSCKRIEIVPGVTFGNNEVETIFVDDDEFEPVRITPQGAAYLKAYYLQGLLPMTKGKEPQTVAPELDTYIKSEAKLLSRQDEDERNAAAERKKRDYLVANPEQIKESEFTLSLLNEVFFKHHGPRHGRLSVGGIDVHKTIRSYSSNSGKSRSWSYEYTWVSGDGKQRAIEYRSPYEGNRRNDPERNWGLPE